MGFFPSKNHKVTISLCIKSVLFRFNNFAQHNLWILRTLVHCFYFIVRINLLSENSFVSVVTLHFIFLLHPRVQSTSNIYRKTMRTVKTCSNAYKVYSQQSEAHKTTTKIEQTIFWKFQKVIQLNLCTTTILGT